MYPKKEIHEKPTEKRDDFVIFVGLASTLWTSWCSKMTKISISCRSTFNSVFLSRKTKGETITATVFRLFSWSLSQWRKKRTLFRSLFATDIESFLFCHYFVPDAHQVLIVNAWNEVNGKHQIDFKLLLNIWFLICWITATIQTSEFRPKISRIIHTL